MQARLGERPVPGRVFLDTHIRAMITEKGPGRAPVRRITLKNIHRIMRDRSPAAPLKYRTPPQ